jgi:hypothetical protein
MKTIIIIIIIIIFIKIIFNALEYVPITFETTQLFPYYIFGMNLSMLASWTSKNIWIYSTSTEIEPNLFTFILWWYTNM